MSEINEAESNLIHEVGNNEVESTITMSTSNDDRAESSITMSVDPQEAESSITMGTHDHEAESDITNTTEEEPTSGVHKLDTFEDIEVENDATIGGTLRAHKIVVPLGEHPEENGKDIYSTGAAYKHSATYIEVDGSQSDSGLIGLTLVNAKGEALGKKVYIDTGISQAILKAIKEARAASKGDAQTISNGVVDMLGKYVRDEIEKLTLKYISKIHPDTAQEIITFLRGLYVGERGRGIDENGNAILLGVIGESFKSEDYRKGLVDGAGFGIYIDDHGKSIADVDKLNVRQKATFAELEIRKFAFTTGDVGYTSAACKISIVKDIDNAYRCYFLADDGDKRISNDWHIGDQAICKTGNLISRTTKNASNRYYWRLVVNKGEETINGKLYYFIDLSNIKGSLDLTIEGKVYSCVGCDTSVDNDVPQTEDSVIQLGSQTDTDRQYAYIVYVSEGRRVDYAGINDYDLTTHIINDFSPRGITLRSDSLKIISAAGTGISQALVCDRGEFITGVTTAGHYDRFSYQGSLWLCIVGKGQTTTDPPSETSTKWLKQVARGERGAQGTNGADGIPGKNGIDGKTSYLHIAYANSADGRTDFDISNFNGKGYIGTYTDFVQADSTDPTKYKWARIKGEDGTNGTSEKTYIRYSDDNGATFTKAIPLKSTGDMFAGRNIFAVNAGLLAEAGAILDSSIRGVKCTKTKSLNRVGQLFKRFKDNLPSGKFRISGRLKTDGTTFSVNINMGGVNAGDVTATPNWQPFNLLVNNPGYSDAPNYCFVDFRYGMTQPTATALNLYVADLMITQGEEEYEYAPAPEDQQFGLTTGKYIGIATWDKPYPPLNPNAYMWSAFKGEDGKDAEIYRLKASKESAKVTADGLLICDAAYTIEHVQGTSVEVITSEGATGNKPYISAHTDKGVNINVTADANNTILYKLNGYFDLASRPDNIIVELYVKVGGSAKIVDTRVIPILMEAMSYTRMVRDMRENISANGRDISTIRQTANSASVKVNNTEARLENGDFVVKSDTTKFIGSDGQKKVLIKDGKVSAELIDAKQIVAEGIQGNTIDAKNATFNNVNVSGTLKGVSGTFRQLQCENYIPGEDPTTLMFDSEGKFLIRDGDLIMSSQLQRKPRLIPVNTWVMGTFGAKRRTTMVVKGTTADFYLNDVKASPYTQTLEIKSTTDGDIYEVPCFCYDNSGHTIYEFPVDTIVFNVDSASTFRYELVMYDTQRCMVINANDKADNVYIYSNGVPVRWDGGEVAEVIKLPITMLTPKVPAEFTGAGLMIGAFRDNNWGNLKNIGGV
ncbi:MAG: hypothetical protein HXO16_01955 [Prevotella salivae]|nr:hypothetical protein [Segatella salivae]